MVMSMAVTVSAANYSSKTRLDSLVINTSSVNRTRGTVLLSSSKFESDTYEYTVFLDKSDKIKSVYLWMDTVSDAKYMEIMVDSYTLDADEWDGYEIRLDMDDDEQTVAIRSIYNGGDYSKYYITFKFGDANSTELEAVTINSSSSSKSRGTIYFKTDDLEKSKYTYDIYLENEEVDTVYLWLDTVAAADDLTLKVGDRTVKEADWDGYKVSLDRSEDPYKLYIRVINGGNTTRYTFNFNFGTESKSKESMTKLCVSKRKNSHASAHLLDMYPVFDASNQNYSVFLTETMQDRIYDDEDGRVYVYFELENRNNYVAFDGGTEYSSKSYIPIELDDIGNGEKYDLVVFDDDDAQIETYTLTFYLGKDKYSDVSSLKALSIRNKTSSSGYTAEAFNEDFSAKTYKYTVSLEENSYRTVRIYATPKDSEAYVLINGKKINTSGYAELEVKNGENVFNIDVIAQNCDDSDSYTITVNYGAPAVSLRSLVLRDSASTVDFSPAFKTATLNYTAIVPNTTTSVALRPIASNDGAVMLFNSQRVTSGNISSFASLSEGINNLALTVNSDSKSPTVYRFSVYRQPAKPGIVISDQKMKVNGVSKQLVAYNINGNNFVKLRDIASAVNGTSKNFSVAFDQARNAVVLGSGARYVENGQENTALSAPTKIEPLAQTIYKDGEKIVPMAYNINDNNYVMLRDIGLLFDFSVTYDSSTATVVIDTASGYKPE